MLGFWVEDFVRIGLCPILIYDVLTGLSSLIPYLSLQIPEDPKKCLVVLALCLWIGQLADAAPTMLTIHSKDGSTFSYCFADKPEITYNDDTLVLKTDKVNVEYPFSVLLKMTFTDTETSVETVTMSQSGEVSMVRIFNANGALVKTIEADETGADISFSTKDLPTGVYLIQEKSKSYKIIKK